VISGRPGILGEEFEDAELIAHRKEMERTVDRFQVVHDLERSRNAPAQHVETAQRLRRIC
jgi:hypothetical protein